MSDIICPTCGTTGQGCYRTDCEIVAKQLDAAKARIVGLEKDFKQSEREWETMRAALATAEGSHADAPNELESAGRRLARRLETEVGIVSVGCPINVSVCPATTDGVHEWGTAGCCACGAPHPPLDYWLTRIQRWRDNYLRERGECSALEEAPAPAVAGVCQHCGIYIGVAVTTHERYCDLSPQQQPIVVVQHDCEKAAKGECRCPGCIAQQGFEGEA